MNGPFASVSSLIAAISLALMFIFHSIPGTLVCLTLWSVGFGLKQNILFATFPDFCPAPEDNDILHEDVRRAFGDHGLRDMDIPEFLLGKCVAESRKVPPIFHYEG